MKKYGLYGKLKATQGNTDKLVEILLDAAEIISKAEGCCLYLVSKDAKDKQSPYWTGNQKKVGNYRYLEDMVYRSL